MTEENLKTIVLSSLFWKFLERIGVFGTQAIVQIVLARLLLPEDYGVIALIAVFITIGQILIASGLNSALIQKKNVDDVDYSSVFYVSLVLAIILYIIIFITSPFLAEFYGNEILTPVLRILGLTLFFGAITSIQNVVISRTFKFKLLFISSLGSMIISGIVGIAMAYLGYGVWALVAQQLVSYIVTCVILGLTVSWRPKLLFSFIRVKSHFSFGWKILVSALMDTLYNNLPILIIGKLYPANIQGYYVQGQHYPNMLVLNLDSTIQAVIFPTYAKNQDNIMVVKQIMRRALITSSFVVFPSMAGLAAVAQPLVLLLLTEKWLLVVPFLQIFCCVYALYPMHTVTLQALNGIRRSDIYLKLEVIKKIVGVIIIFVTIPLGIYAIAIGMIFTGIIATIINSFPNKKYLDYGLFEQFSDIMPSLLISIIMFVIIYVVTLTSLSCWLMLIIQIPLGIIIYFGLAKMCKLDCLTYVVNTIIEYLPKKK